MNKTIQISVIEFTADLKNAMSDEGLRRKYGLSETDLKRIFDRFLRAMSEGSRQIEIDSDGSEPRAVEESLPLVEMERR